MRALYDTIGAGYEHLRRPDPRIAAVVLRGLGSSRTVVNVGAGAGSYEPSDRAVVAVDLSVTMLHQRALTAAPAVQASASSLPFADNAFDASLAILTIHHWPDRAKGLQELARVARSRVVIVTWDPEAPGFWLADYFPEILAIDQRIFPSTDELQRELGRITVTEVPIPHDCVDGFLGAYWRRPTSYLDPRVRKAISTFSKLSDVATGLARLQRDLASGHWNQQYGEVLAKEELDLGYRLAVAELGESPAWQHLAN